jgi:hypothetical protein
MLYTIAVVLIILFDRRRSWCNGPIVRWGRVPNAGSYIRPEQYKPAVPVGQRYQSARGASRCLRRLSLVRRSLAQQGALVSHLPYAAERLTFDAAQLAQCASPDSG